MHSRRLVVRICIVAHFAFGAMNGGADGHSGGVERQTSLMARWLAGHGHDTSLITWDEGQAEGLVLDGVRMIKLCRRDEGLPGLRFFHPRWTRLNGALIEADADLYYQNCAEYVTGQVAWWCRRYGRRFVYSVASDPDCDPRLPQMHTRRERFLYRYGLMHSAKIIVQTRTQQQLLREGFGLDSIPLPMPCPGPSEHDPPRLSTDPFRVVWVGRIAPVKRLDVLLDAAEALPGIRFDIAGKADAAESYTGTLLERARRVGNVILHGHVGRDRMSEIFRTASVLCCTSEYEGFPNTFLEAWSYGVPVVSTVDPDSLLSEKGIGIFAAHPADVVPAILRLQRDKDLFRSVSSNARRYFLENHILDSAMRRFEDLFERALSDPEQA